MWPLHWNYGICPLLKWVQNQIEIIIKFRAETGDVCRCIKTRHSGKVLKIEDAIDEKMTSTDYGE
jgi:hypothetical protein